VGEKIIRCRKCGGEILFITTPKGHKMPVDAVQPSANNSKLRVVRKDGTVATGYTVGDEALVSHWATCTAPDEFRKRERAAKGGA